VSLLEVQGLCRSFGALRAVQDVSLSVEPGERRAIIGPNGAGKTTLFNLISGELPPTAGRVLLAGVDVTRLPPDRRCALGLARTFQRNNLFPGLSVAENLALPLRRRHATSADPFRDAARGYPGIVDEARDMLVRLGLAERAASPARDLSYGEQRQLEIGLALACGPRVLLLDEPTAGMSPAETAQVTGLIRALPRSMAVLIIEHDMDVVFALADRIAVLHNGRLLADDTPEATRANPEVQAAYLGPRLEDLVASGRPAGTPPTVAAPGP
jgi:branched-chain amino acid transport system ATP-binding protein